MPESDFRFGMIGCGEIAVQSCRAVVDAEGACVSAAFDVDEGLARDMAEKAGGASACATQDELLARDDVDGVVVSTPHFLHEPCSVAALEAGKHVLVEKPIACTTGQAARMVKAAGEADRRLGVCFVSRYSPAVQVIRKIVSDGRIGAIMSIVLESLGFKKASYWEGGYTQRSKSDWRTRWETAGGGYLIMNLIHAVDHLRFMTGEEIADANAFGGTYNSPPGVEVEDMIWAAVRLSGGGAGLIGGGSAVPGSGLREERIVGTRGQIKLGRPASVYFEEAAEVDGQAIPAGEWTELEPASGQAARPNPRRLMVESFARWARGEGEFFSPGEDALKTLDVIERIYRSAGLIQA